MMLQRAGVVVCAWIVAACAGTGWPTAPRPIARPAQPPVLAVAKPDQTQASRFLQQATFGPRLAEIDTLSREGYARWFDEQFATPQTLVLPLIDAEKAKLPAGQKLNQQHYFSAFWKTSATAPDQLRQRVAFALSEIFVVSFEGMLDDKIRAVSSYHDMLARNSFGDFRTLIEEVSLHPAMGIYLSHMRNQKEDPKRGRVPDENYAREVMQLFTIGLQELNLDGTPKMKNGVALETYDNDDITGLAKVFTGYSHGGDGYTNQHFNGRLEADWEVLPMKAFPQFHSTSAKEFLGLKLPATTEAQPQAERELKAALDHLFAHPNVGPFIGKQLIQRLVKSNPGPDYVRRVAQAFNDNGAGVRGDMQAVVMAVLMDPDARALQAGGSGKLREPILRQTQWMRAFNASSISGDFLSFNTDNPGSALGQSPMRSPTVFNFYRPGYMPPGTQIARAGMVAPEMQIVSESSVAGYANYMQTVIESGAGRNVLTANNRRDIQPDYSAQMAIAHDAAKLVDHLDLLLSARQLSPTSLKRITEAVASINIPANNPAQAENARRNRVRLGILLTMVSPEYLVQR